MPEPKTGRIPCLNPRCRRTAPAAKFDPGTEIVCGKCWKLLPPAVRARYRALNKRARRIIPKLDRLQAGSQAPAIALRRAENIDAALHRLRRRNWAAIRAVFIRPEAPPAELAAFMREMGFDA